MGLRPNEEKTHTDVTKRSKGIRLPVQKTQNLIQIAGSLMTFPANLDGTVVNMCFDSGAGHRAASSELFKSVPGIAKFSESTSWTAGKFEARNHFFSELNLGHRLSFHNVGVQLTDNWAQNDLGKNTKVNAILGSPILNDLKRLTIDYPNSQLIFER